MRDHKVVERDERSQGSKEMRRDNAEEREREMTDHQAVELNDRSQGIRER